MSSPLELLVDSIENNLRSAYEADPGEIRKWVEVTDFRDWFERVMDDQEENPFER